MNTRRGEIKNIIGFLGETERLKSVLRHSWMSSGRQESVAEHSWRMAIMALVLHKYFPEANLARVVELSLFHDIGEAYDGDTPAFQAQPHKLEKEERAVRKLVTLLPEKEQAYIMELWREYSEYKTLEGKLAKALDKLEVLIQHNEADISTWDPIEFEFNVGDYADTYTRFHDFLQEFREIVREMTAQKIKDR